MPWKWRDELFWTSQSDVVLNKSPYDVDALFGIFMKFSEADWKQKIIRETLSKQIVAQLTP